MRMRCGDVERELDSAWSEVYIGRSPACDVVVAHPMMSSRQAVLRFTAGHWTLTDLGSTNGMYLDGIEVRQVRIDRDVALRLADPDDGPILEFLAVATQHAAPGASPGGVSPNAASPYGSFVAPVLPSLPAPPFEPLRVPTGVALPGLASPAGSRDSGEAPVFAVYDLTVETNGTRRLDRVTFSLGRGVMLGLLGGSGAGKSTLLKAITGSDPATGGTVRFEGHDLYRAYIDTLAAAHAEMGNFSEAARWQAKALELPDFQDQILVEARGRLALYQSGRPYRESPNR